MISEAFRYRPVNYFLAVISTTTLFWSLGGYMSFKPEWAEFYMLPMLLGLMMPACLAIGFIWRQPKKYMKQDFIRRAVSLRLIRPWPFIGSLALMPLSVIIAISWSLFFGGSKEQFAISEAFSFNSGFVPVLLLLFLAAVFEELGWRGYGFESIEQNGSFGRASLIFGALWSLWHLPLLWVNNTYQYEIYQQSPWFAVNFYVGTALMGVIVSWVCYLNNRSILATILFHYAINLSQEALSMTQTTKCLQTLVLAVFVLLIVSSQWPLFSHKKEGEVGAEYYQ